MKESSGSEADAGSDHEPSAPPAFAVSQQGEDSGETTDVFDWQGDESEMPGPAAPVSGSLEQRLGDVLGDDIAGDHSGSAAPGSGRQLKRNESTASSSRMQKRWRSLAETEFGKWMDWSQTLQEMMRVDQQWADQLLRAITHQLDQRKARGGLSRAMVFESLCTATGACIYNWQAGHKLLSLTRCDVMFRVFLFVICFILGFESECLNDKSKNRFLEPAQQPSWQQTATRWHSIGCAPHAPICSRVLHAAVCSKTSRLLFFASRFAISTTGSAGLQGVQTGSSWGFHARHFPNCAATAASKEQWITQSSTQYIRLSATFAL